MLSEKLHTKPSVVICTPVQEPCEDKLRELQAGLEEEGVPYTLVSRNDSDMVSLAWQGAVESQLGVGLGVSSQGLAIHYHKLHEQEPLFTLEAAVDDSECRMFGANAARLVKGMPFKTEFASELSSDQDLGNLYEQVRQVVTVVLQELAQFQGR